MKNIIILLAAAVVLVSGASIKEEKSDITDEFAPTPDRFEEVSFEEMKRRTNFPKTPTDENGLPEGSVLVDGDMLISKENLHLWESGQYMASGQAWGNFPKWKLPISIGIDNALQGQMYQWTIDSINEIEQKTCIKFNRIYQPINGPYMLVKLSDSCYATFGQQFPRENLVNIGVSCTSSRTPAHEIIHSLGRFHEQTRMDRDNYIRVNYGNLNCPDQYDKRPSATYGIPYDYYSVMHYNIQSCSTGGPTMSFPPGVNVNDVGRESWLTQSDIDHMNAHYCGSG